MILEDGHCLNLNKYVYILYKNQYKKNIKM
jgi:hypothetical protein